METVLRDANQTSHSPLTEQRERLRSILDGVKNAADDLAKRLEPVLSPRETKVDGSALREISPSESPLAAELRSRADEADWLQTQLRDLVARIELD